MAAAARWLARYRAVLAEPVAPERAAETGFVGVRAPLGGWQGLVPIPGGEPPVRGPVPAGAVSGVPLAGPDRCVGGAGLDIGAPTTPSAARQGTDPVCGR